MATRRWLLVPALVAPALLALPARADPRPTEKATERCSRLARDLLQQQRRSAVALTDEQKAEQRAFAAEHVDCFDLARASKTSGIEGEELLRAVAQVVATRATRAAWSLLRDRLREGARCDEAAPGPHPFPATCRTLGSVAIQDLLSSPVALTSAVVSDLLTLVQVDASRAWMSAPILDDALREAAVRWDQGGARSLTSGFLRVVRKHLRREVASPRCDDLAGAARKSLWVVGMCLVQVQNQGELANCDVDGWASQCTDAPTTERIFQVWSAFARAFGGGDQSNFTELAGLVFLTAELAVDDDPARSVDQKRRAHEYVGALKAMFLGIAGKDWIQATSGATRALRAIAESAPACAAAGSLACAAVQADRRRTEGLLMLLAAAGNYAEAASSSGPGASAAREKIIEELAFRMVNRTDREGGAVVSLGGNLGIFGGARTDFSKGAAVGFPVQLGVGVGVQSYGRGDGGFHAMLTAVDLGQYVAFDSGSLKVKPAAGSAVVSLGATVGAWVALRETPLYVGLYGGVSPFVQTDDSRLTYQLGAVSGIYLPLFDLN